MVVANLVRTMDCIGLQLSTPFSDCSQICALSTSEDEDPLIPYRTGHGVLGAINPLPLVGSLFRKVPGNRDPSLDTDMGETLLSEPSDDSFLQAISSHEECGLLSHEIAAQSPTTPEISFFRNRIAPVFPASRRIFSGFT